MAEVYTKCCMCGKAVEKGDTFYRCAVSACNSGRLKLAFCSTKCWDAHLPVARHRKASHTEVVAGQED